MGKHRGNMVRSLMVTGAVVVALLAAATARAAVLVTPTGQPVGGTLQRWIGQMREPSYLGSITLVTDPTGKPCGPVQWPTGGCMWQNPDGTFDIAILGHPVDARLILYHELGHIFDYAYLDGLDRRYLESLMGDAGHVWDEYTDTSGHGGAQDDFAELYALCAENYGRRHWNPFWWPTFTPNFADLRQVCAFIRAGSLPISYPR